MPSDRPLLGIALMLGFCLLAPLADALTKIVGASVPLLQFLLIRFGMQTLLLAPAAQRSRRRPSARMLGFAAWRTACHLVGIGAMFLSLRFLPLADAIAIAYVMPFLVLVLGRILLGDAIGWRRLVACLAGFAGTLLVIQPSFLHVGAPALLPLVVALAFALFMLATRQAAREIDPVTLQALTGLMGTGVCLALLPLGSFFAPFRLVGMGWEETALVLAIGVLGTLALLLMTWSLRHTAPGVVAPIQYLEIPFATLIGWLVFGDLPQGAAVWGILLILAAGLAVVALEHRGAAKAIAAPTPAP